MKIIGIIFRWHCIRERIIPINNEWEVCVLINGLKAKLLIVTLKITAWDTIDIFVRLLQNKTYFRVAFLKTLSEVLKHKQHHIFLFCLNPILVTQLSYCVKLWSTKIWHKLHLINIFVELSNQNIFQKEINLIALRLTLVLIRKYFC